MKVRIIGSLQKLHRYWDWKRISNNIKYLIKNDLRGEWYRLKDETIEDCVYEFDELNKAIIRLPILNEHESLMMLKKEPKSFSRFGDGEICIMQGKDTPFQDYSPELSEKMTSILSKKRDNLYVGLQGAYFQSPAKYGETHRKFYRVNGTRYRRFFLDVCDKNNVYLSTGTFGGYFKESDSMEIESRFEIIKDLFKDKNIALVCGEGILDKLQYDIFERCRDKIIINAPRVNAFCVYDDILDRIRKKVPKDYLVCIILGMTATVLSADLADEGYIAWDVGHAAKEYDYYMRGVEKNDAVIKKFYAPD